MQSLFLSAVFFGLMFLGFTAAFATALGFVWVDIVKPQQLAYAIITGWPLSMIAALAMLVQYAANDRKHPPKFGPLLVMLLLFSIWVTLTTSMSTIPGRPWEKWDWVIKVLVFAMFIPYVFRTRVQIEAFILVFVFAAATIFSSAGVKTLLGSGGYRTLAIMGGGNSGLSEGSTLAVVCVMLVPLILFAMRHTILLPRNWMMTGLCLGMIVTSLATVVGTSARTGVIAALALYVIATLKAKKKIWWILIGLAVGAWYATVDLSNTMWGARMSTIETYNQDSSAMGRVKVWEWTVGYVTEHPMGGGFDAYIHNRIANVTEDGVVHHYPDSIMAGKAFHSIYFEVLGEQGFPGAILYFAMIVYSLMRLNGLKKKWRAEPGMAWLVGLADALISSFVVFLVGGSFVGIAYQPYIFYMIGLTVAIDQYSARVEQDLKRSEKGRLKT